MEISNILTADVLDIIFDGKNKSYGAYELRKTYKRRLVFSLAIMITLFLVLIGSYLLASNSKDPNARPLEFARDVELEKIHQPEKEEVKLPPPPKPPEPPKQIATRMFTTPQIITEVNEADKPPTMEELVDVKIGTQNHEGTPDDGILGPPAKSDGEGKGIIEKPVQKDPDDGFIPVEIESSYPGGPGSWTRFLNKQLSRSYPQEAIDNQIQGKVVIQFIVDAQGNVSNVEAISGPSELHDAAINVIKKSGKWIPAIQNKNYVKSYKRQPIVFSLGEE